MVRPLRRPVADGWYHVFGRGNERREIFGDAGDREHFLFLWGVRQVCGLTLREAGRQVGSMHFSTVSTAVRRLEKRAVEDSSLRAMQTRLLQMANDEP